MHGDEDATDPDEDKTELVQSFSAALCLFTVINIVMVIYAVKTFLLLNTVR
jgi:hypothetical protein